ncbi:MAG: alpha amylase C-terminal domain-containing protein [Marinilabiliaceae bacterium]|nr:alpha amylase C-terminal domain-containing protein [Marinilabiliaceae bacterium]
MKELGLISKDPWLKPFEPLLEARHLAFENKLKELAAGKKSLKEFANSHLYFGLHLINNQWILREWAPNASKIYMIGNFSNWIDDEKYRLHDIGNGHWELKLPKDDLQHKELYKLHIFWPDGNGNRIPTHAKRVVQDDETLIFSAQIWQPETDYKWKNTSYLTKNEAPIIYEAHIGMSSEEGKVSSFSEFKETVLPRIKSLGYNTIQLMAIQEHPYYGSFGYHVSNFFAASSRFGTPEELKELIDTAHGMGIKVIMDLVHSHAVKNEIEGLGKFDGTNYQFFHDGNKGEHPAWDSKCFNYSKNEVIHFLLSNCQFWLQEYHFDGFRFDGVTSMIYNNHGLGIHFASYSDYFQNQEDEDAITYLTLANYLIHEINPNAISIAEEMSGYPGLAGNVNDGGIGFDYRLSMGIPDFWIKLIKEVADDNWSMGQIYHELTQHRVEEKTISYVESHDQALVGDKTIIFRLIDKEMYFHMNKASENLVIDRGIALHKMIRLVTLATCNGGYLNFMGNEFGHPEWIDFPREGNNWSYHYAKRQWSLADNMDLKYHYLKDFDADMVNLLGSKINLLPGCFLILANETDKVLAFSRGDFIFVFNFNPTNSFTDYGINVQAGKYGIILNSDNTEYGGFNRIDDNLFYFSNPIKKDNSQHQIKLYIPSRVALVLRKIQTRSVY